jgi:glycosyltransferase involved in cell wall biosynthesis
MPSSLPAALSAQPVLRLALIGPVPPPAGGMANQTRQLMELLGREGVAVEMVAVNPPYPAAWVERLKGVRAAVRLAQYLPRLWQAAGRNDVFHVMANSGWSWHLFAAPAVWIARLRGVPAVVNYRGGEAETFLARSAAAVLPTLRRAAVLAVPSGFLHDVFGRWRVDSRIVPNIIDTQRFRPAAEPAAGQQIVITRNLEPIYAIDVAIQAFARIAARWPQASLAIAGSGPEKDRLQALAAALGLAARVRFLGRLSPDQTAELYRQAALFLNPSSVDNMPNSVLEAWASGVPVVSTRVGGVPYIAQDGVDALLVPAGDAAAMGDALARMLADPALAGRLRTAGLAAAERYTWARIRPLWLDLYRELASPSRRRLALPADRQP